MEQKSMHKQGTEGKSQTDTRWTTLSSYPLSLRLTEPLRICLLAIAHRYPKHSLDINEALLGPQDVGAEGWQATDLIELLQEVAPQMLPALARLEVTVQRRAIYLLDSSEEVAAFWLHCGGDGERIPVCQGNLALRRAELARRSDERLRVREVVHAVQTESCRLLSPSAHSQSG
jgi:hypothetical protein